MQENATLVSGSLRYRPSSEEQTLCIRRDWLYTLPSNSTASGYRVMVRWVFASEDAGSLTISPVGTGPVEPVRTFSGRERQSPLVSMSSHFIVLSRAMNVSLRATDYSSFSLVFIPHSSARDKRNFLLLLLLIIIIVNPFVRLLNPPLNIMCNLLTSIQVTTTRFRSANKISKARGSLCPLECCVIRRPDKHYTSTACAKVGSYRTSSRSLERYCVYNYRYSSLITFIFSRWIRWVTLQGYRVTVRRVALEWCCDRLTIAGVGSGLSYNYTSPTRATGDVQNIRLYFTQSTLNVSLATDSSVAAGGFELEFVPYTGMNISIHFCSILLKTVYSACRVSPRQETMQFF